MAGTILVADDNLTNQRTATEMLTQEGFEVVAVGNGMAALKKLSTLRPLAVLADVDMPGKDGYEVCEFVKRQPELSRVRVLLAVSDTDPYDPKRGSRSRADGIIKKPFDRKELTSVIIRYANEFEAQQSREINPASSISNSWPSEAPQEIPFAEQQPTVYGAMAGEPQPGEPFPSPQPVEESPWAMDTGSHQPFPPGAPGPGAEDAEVMTVNESRAGAPESSSSFVRVEQANRSPLSELPVNSPWEGEPVPQSDEAHLWSLPEGDSEGNETRGLAEQPSTPASVSFPPTEQNSEGSPMPDWEFSDTPLGPPAEPLRADVAAEGAASTSQYEEMVQSLFLHDSTTDQVSASQIAGSAGTSGSEATSQNDFGYEESSPFSSLSNLAEFAEPASAISSHAGAVDSALIASIVHKVILRMSPPALPPEVIQSLEQKLIQEIAADLATSPISKGPKP